MSNDQIDKLFIKPNIEPLDQNSQRIRRNLFVFSIVGLFITKGAANLDLSNSSFLGVKFHDLNITYVHTYLLVSILYFTVHFIWSTLDSFKENMMRLTGVAIPMVTQSMTWGSRYNQAPNTDDKRQTSIYSWYAMHYKSFVAQENLINEKLKSVTDEASKKIFEELNNEIKLFKSRHDYIDAALQRYERGFWKYQISQTLRWLFLDYVIPLALGCVSIYFLTSKVLTP